MEQLYARAKKRIYKVKRYWLTLAFFFGFLLDNITLNRVDQVFDNVVLLFYVLLAMGSLLLTYATAAEKVPERIYPYAKLYAPLLVQFAFGGLLSGMLIFYGRSGSWFESWPFLLLLIGVIYGNETIKNRSQRLIFNIALLFVGLFSYVVLIVPVIIAEMGAWVFVGSGVIAFFIMFWFLRQLRRIVPNFIQLHLRAVVFTVGTIFVSFNFLYFTNIIPPIPLSLKEVGIYHNVVHLKPSGTYQVTYERPPWYQFWVDSDTTFHPASGGAVYCYASVFAPTRLETDIFHRWERYDENRGTWIEHDRLSYHIEGGRSGGYRGYTYIENSTPGEWRCSVETRRGQVIGQESFRIEAGVPGELVTDSR